MVGGPKDEYSSAEAAAKYGESSLPTQSMWVGWISFAGMIMAMLGAFHMMQGFLAIRNDDNALVPEDPLFPGIEDGTWGWIYLVGGAVIFAAGLGVFTGKWWARLIGVGLAFASMIGNFILIGAHPTWSLLVIGMNFMIIFALTVHGSEVKEVPLPPG